MKEIKDIAWQQLSGNKFNKSLHPAMLSDSGYFSTVRIKRIGDSEPDIFNVIYDRNYAVDFITRKFIRPLAGAGKNELLKLFSEAWILYEKEALTPHFVNQSID